MVYGAILEKGLDWYTDLSMIFDAVSQVQKKYNWLVTDWECNQFVDGLCGEYCWMAGTELTDMIHKNHPLQWIWGVFSGFSKMIPKEEILKPPFPISDSDTFWKNPVSIQHPLADLEIVPWDSSLVLFMSRERKIVENFRKSFPLSEDLFQYNNAKQAR